ncbi:branched-chain amino acid ABC transporter permease [Saccharomonospora sp. NPDC006951]
MRVHRLLVPVLVVLVLPALGPAEAMAQDTGTVSGPSALSKALQALLNGVQFGSVIAITAVGLSLVFGTTRLINFAHGELVTVGAVTAFFFNAAAGGPGWPLILSAVLAVIAGGLLGGLIELGLFRPLRARGTSLISLFIITIGLSLLLRHLVLILFGTSPRSYSDYDLQRAWDLGPVSITPRDLTIIGLSVLVLLGVALMLQKTRIGTAIRAVASNRDLAESSGIDVRRVVLVVWLLGGALAALGGVFFGLAEVITWDMGFRLLLLMFAGIILGGLGSAYGAMVGSFVIGIVAQVSTLWFPIDLQNAWALLVLIVVLLIRPQGILGRRERVG